MAEGSKPILVVNVDSSEFDAFIWKFQAYQAALKDQPEAWQAINKEIAGASSAFEEAAVAASKIDKAVTNPKFSGRSGAIARVAKDSKETAKDWAKTSKELQKSGRELSGIARMAIGLRAFGKGMFGVIGAGAATVAATVTSAKDFSDQNRQNKELGLKPGEAKAFSDQFGTTLGINDSFLAKIADIKANPGRFSELASATAGNISFEDVQTLDTESLAEKVIRESARARNAMGGQWSADQGADELIGAGALRNAAGRTPEFFDQLHEKYAKERDRIAPSESDLESSTDFTQKWKDVWATFKNNFESATVPLQKPLLDLADAASGAASALEKIAVPQLKGVLDAVTDDKPVPRSTDGTYPHSVVGGLTQGGYWLRDHIPFLKDTFGPDTNQPEGGGTNFDKALGAIRWNESRGNPNAVNPKTGASGLYGLMPKTAAAYGVDPKDPVQSRYGASQLLKHDLDRFKTMDKALAAYDWGEGNLAKDIAKWGDKWRDHMPEETKQYLIKSEWQGVDLKAGYDGKDVPEMMKRAKAVKDDATIEDYSPADAKAKHEFDNASNRRENVQGMSMLARSVDALRSTLKEGGGAGFRTPDTPKNNTGQQAPIRFEVISRPEAGSNIGVSAGSLGY